MAIAGAGGMTGKAKRTKGAMSRQHTGPVLRKIRCGGFDLDKAFPAPVSQRILHPLRRSAAPARPCLASEMVFTLPGEIYAHPRRHSQQNSFAAFSPLQEKYRLDRNRERFESLLDVDAPLFLFCVLAKRLCENPATRRSVIGIRPGRIHRRRGDIDRLRDRRLANSVTFRRHTLGVNCVVTRL